MPRRGDGNISFIVAHKLFKEQNSDVIDKQFADELIDIDDVATLFVNNFRKANNVRQGLQHGIFVTDEKVFPVQRHIHQYCNVKTAESFLGMSIEIGKHLEKCLRNERRSTGGYLIVFAYNDDEKGQIIAIAVMTDKANSGLDENTLKFTRNMSLNLDKMNVATTVIVDRWLDPQNTINYLTFMSGLKDISLYYKDKFIGCDNVQLSALATKSALDAVEQFLKTEKHYDDIQLNQVRSEIVTYFDDNPSEVTLQYIQNIAFPDPTMQEEFASYIERENLELSASFKPNKKSYKSWKKLYYDKAGIKIDISADKVKDRTVKYDIENHCLVINDPNGDLRAEYQKFISEGELED